MAVGYASHAEGIQTRANQKCCHAEGSYSQAIGEYSHAEGSNTEAWGNFSHAEGSYSEAIGYASHAEGMHTVAFGDYSHTEGAYTKALSRSTNTIGEYNIPDSIYYKEKGISGLYDRVSISMSNNSDIYCSKEYSFDIETGLYTLISPSKVSSNDLRYKQDYYFISNTEKKFERNTISGKILLQVTKNIEAIQNFNNWNFNHVYYEQGESDGSKKGNYVHIVGNGKSESTRSNAHTIDWNGNGWFAGNIYIGGTGQDDDNTDMLVSESHMMEYVEDKVSAARNTIYMIDSVTGLKYFIQIQNGILMPVCRCNSIQVEKMPAKTTYIRDERFDPTDMVVVALCDDGTIREITGYTYSNNPLTLNDTSFTINYSEFGENYSTAIDIVVNEV